MDLTTAPIIIGILGGILVLFLGYIANGKDDEELARLKELLDIGAIKQYEFDDKKKELLSI
ncbi:SHOCT domain-containing protein [Metaclostridioides mangenotii]|uniref:SHOCT domain-containing protein n=1 Tax=Metaclostridioides mangenotii TaxID=1540 RepID=UPI000480660A|nr:SHOCT domain-containing protein [Clostridioides mangenotii]